MGGPEPNDQGLLAFQAMSVGLREKPKRADQVFAQWARTNDYLDGNVAGKSVLDQVGELTNGSVPGGYSFQKCKYEDSAGRLLMEKWLIQGMGHAWSGSPAAGRFADPRGPNASEEMWRFFCDTTLASLDHPTSRPALRGALANLFHRAVQCLKPSVQR